MRPFFQLDPWADSGAQVRQGSESLPQSAMLSNGKSQKQAPESSTCACFSATKRRCGRREVIDVVGAKIVAPCPTAVSEWKLVCQERTEYRERNIKHPHRAEEGRNEVAPRVVIHQRDYEAPTQAAPEHCESTEPPRQAGSVRQMRELRTRTFCQSRTLLHSTIES